MRKTLFLVAAFLITGSSFGQDFAFDRGVFIIGGSASGSFSSGELYEDNDGDGLEQYTLAPDVLYFVTRGLAVGGMFSFGGTQQGDVSSTSVGFAPEVAYYFGDMDATTFPFLSLAPGYVSSESSGGFGNSSSNGFSLVLTGGIAVLLARSASVTIGAYYQLRQMSIGGLDESRSGNIIGVKAGVQAHIF